MKYLMPELHGYIELISRRKIHTPAGIDKIILIYTYECEQCQWTTTQPGLRKIRKAADMHYMTVHNPNTSDKIKDMLSIRNQAGNPPQTDLPDF